MDWLHNPIADLSSTEFLLAYALCIAGAVVAVRLRADGADPTRGEPPPPVATDGDPGEIAYLRGAGNELLRFTVFDLMRRGALRIAPPPPGKKAKPSAAAIEPGEAAIEHPTELEAAVLAFYDAPHTTADLFASTLPKTAEAFGAARYRAGLEQRGFYTAPQVRATARVTAVAGAIAIALLGTYRIAEALARGHHNVGITFVLLFLGVFAVALAARTGRLSARGRAHLTRLRTALGPMKAAPALAGAAALPIFVAATGFAALAGTEFAPVNVMFRRQASASGGDGGSCSSCSSGSSGSSCGGGSGCGGGCGG